MDPIRDRVMSIVGAIRRRATQMWRRSQPSLLAEVERLKQVPIAGWLFLAGGESIVLFYGLVKPQSSPWLAGVYITLMTAIWIAVGWAFVRYYAQRYPKDWAEVTAWLAKAGTRVWRLGRV